MDGEEEDVLMVEEPHEDDDIHDDLDHIIECRPQSF